MGTNEYPLPATNLVFTNQCQSRLAPRVLIWQDLRHSKDTFFNIAWKVIPSCGYGWSHPFPFPNLEISFEDSFGNHTPRQPVASGDSFVFCQRQIQKVAEPNSRLTNCERILFRNGSDSQKCRATLWRGQNRIGCTSLLDPNGSASCLFHQKVRLGVIPEAQENTYLSEDLMSRCRDELSFKGVISGSLVMMGGGWGAKATAFSFHLLDVNKFRSGAGVMRQRR